MNVFCEEYARKEFFGETRKDAYLKAIGWVAKNVLSKDELQGTLVRYEKCGQSPSIVVKLFAEVKFENIWDEHCGLCKDMHKSFFINESNNCNVCHAFGFMRRVNRMMETKKLFYRMELNKVEDF